MLSALLPDYEFDAEIGRGQHGIVWRARHRQLQRPVAVKQLAVTSEEHASRFRREARVLAQIDHPHVVSVYDYRESGDQRVIIMELLSGGTLADRERDGLSPLSAVATALSAATGLAQVHQQGILHRDVKPENLMFDGQGRLKVTDFGLAREDAMEATAVNLTHVGAFFGTPAYVSPEQVGNSMSTGWPAVSAASDQYSLAAVLFEALSGQLTHDRSGGAVALCNLRMNEEATHLREIAPELPTPIGDVLARALRRDPSERYESAEAFADELTRAAVDAWSPTWLAASEVPLLSSGRALGTAREPTVPVGAAPGRRRPEDVTGATGPRSWRRPLLAAGVAVVVVAVAALAIWQNSDADDSAGATANEGAVGPSDEVALDLVEAWSVETGGPVISSPAVSAAGGGDEQVIVGSRDGSVYSIDAATGSTDWTFATEGQVRSSPTVADGDVLIGSDDGFLHSLSLADGSERWKAPIGYQVLSSPAVGAGTVVVGADQLYAFDTATGRPRWVYETGDVIVSSPAIEQDTVFVGSDDGQLHAVSLADGAKRWSRPLGGQVQSSPAVRDGVVFAATTDGALVASDVVDGSELWSVDLGAPILSTPSVAGSQLYIGTGAGRLVAIDPTSGDEIWSFTAPGRFDSSPTANRDVVAVGSTDGSLYLVSAADGNAVGVFTTAGPVLSSPTFVGQRIAVGSNDGSVYLVGGLG